MGILKEIQEAYSDDSGAYMSTAAGATPQNWGQAEAATPISLEDSALARLVIRGCEALRRGLEALDQTAYQLGVDHVMGTGILVDDGVRQPIERQPVERQPVEKNRHTGGNGWTGCVNSKAYNRHR